MSDDLVTDDLSIESYNIFKVRETRARDLNGVREREIKWIYKIKREVSELSNLFSLIFDKGDGRSLEAVCLILL